MPALHELEITTPKEHQNWTDEHYSGHIQMHLGLAIAAEIKEGDGLQENIVEAIILGLEWAARRGWPVQNSFSALSRNVPGRTLLYTVLRANAGVSDAYWDVVNHNPTRAIEPFNFALMHLVGFCRLQGWSIEDMVAENLQQRV